MPGRLAIRDLLIGNHLGWGAVGFRFSMDKSRWRVLFGTFMKDKVLQLILEGQPLSTTQLGVVLGMEPAAVEAQLQALRDDGTLLGWRPILNPDKVAESSTVRAVVEVKIAPEREGGFDRIAERIAKFDRVDSCYLMSGAYDLLVFMEAENLHRVAQFVFEKLAPIDGVQSTATHFLLKAYKESGYLIEQPADLDPKPAVSP